MILFKVETKFHSPVGLTNAGYHANKKESERLAAIQSMFAKAWQHDGENWGFAHECEVDKLMSLGAIPYKPSVSGDLVIDPVNHPNGYKIYGIPVDKFNVLWDGNNVGGGDKDQALTILRSCYTQMEAVFPEVKYENAFCFFEPKNRQLVKVVPVVERPFNL